MRNSTPGRTSSPPSPQPGAVGGPLPLLTTLRKNGNGRRWRIGAGFLVQGLLVVLVLLLPLLLPDQLAPASPDRPIILIPPQRGEPSGNPQARQARDPRSLARARRPTDLTVPIRFRARPVAGGEGSVTQAGIGPGLGDVPPGIPEGLEGGMRPGLGQTVGPQPQLPPPQGPMRVGGRVRSPRLLYRVEPDYPLLAKRAHIEGTVVLEAILGRDGRVQQITVKSGHPLLIPAATTAVSQWVYEPTYLNDQPVPVILQVVVNFRLSR